MTPMPEYISLVLIVSSAIYFDLRTRRIPNFLTFPAILLGLGLHAFYGGWPGFLSSLEGLLLGGGVLLAFYIAGGMGAGDVKLMAGMGALLGVEKAATALVLTALAGGVLALWAVAASHAWKDTYYRMTNIILFRGGSGGAEAAAEREEAHPARLSIPYGVAIGVGSIAALFF